MKRIAACALALILTIGLIGCSSKSAYDNSYEYPKNETTSYEAGYAMEESETDYAMAAGYDGSSSTAAELNTAAEERYGGRKVIKTYELNITTDSFDEHLAAILERAEEFKGYVQNSSVDGTKPEVYGDRGRNAYLTLRIPADKAEEFVNGVKGYGTLTSIYENADDITDEYFDTDTRLEVLKVQLERLESILVETDNLADVIALEERISEVMLEIEELTGTLKKYDALVYYTTVTINLGEESLKQGPAAVTTTGERISEGFSETMNGVGVFFTDFAVWFVTSLPVIVILAVIAVGLFFLIRMCVRRSRRRNAERAAEAAVLQQQLFEKKKAELMAQKNGENDAGAINDTDANKGEEQK